MPCEEEVLVSALETDEDCLKIGVVVRCVQRRWYLVGMRRLPCKILLVR